MYEGKGDTLYMFLEPTSFRQMPVLCQALAGEIKMQMSGFFHVFCCELEGQTRTEVQCSVILILRVLCLACRGTWGRES